MLGAVETVCTFGTRTKPEMLLPIGKNPTAGHWHLRNFYQVIFSPFEQYTLAGQRIEDLIINGGRSFEIFTNRINQVVFRQYSLFGQPRPAPFWPETPGFEYHPHPPLLLVSIYWRSKFDAASLPKIRINLL